MELDKKLIGGIAVKHGDETPYLGTKAIADVVPEITDDRSDSYDSVVYIADIKRKVSEADDKKGGGSKLQGCCRPNDEQCKRHNG